MVYDPWIIPETLKKEMPRQKKDLKQSLEVAKIARAELEECVLNSMRGVILGCQVCRYVYGFMVHYLSFGVEVVEHAWIECNGSIIDPTVALLGSDGLDFQRATYFPVKSISKSEVVRTGFDQAIHPYSREAKRILQEAKAYAQKLACELQLKVHVRRFRPRCEEDEQAA